MKMMNISFHIQKSIQTKSGSSEAEKRDSLTSGSTSISSSSEQKAKYCLSLESKNSN